VLQFCGAAVLRLHGKKVWGERREVGGNGKVKVDVKVEAKAKRRVDGI